MTKGPGARPYPPREKDWTVSMSTGQSELTLRFLAAPTDVAFLGGSVGGGRVLEWIDKAAYALAVGWSGHYCVTAYVGNIHFARPIESGHLVEVHARMIHTGRSSMDIAVTVSAADPQIGIFTATTRCLVVFVAVDANGKSTPVPHWTPATELEERLQANAVERIGLRKNIEAAMARQVYSEAGTAPRITLRFLAAPTDVNWGGKAHGGTVMRWIDEAAYACGAGWCEGMCIAAYSGGVRFYRPIQIGHIVEVQARLLRTGRTSMHIAVHVRSGDPVTREMNLTTHCLTVFVALDDAGRARPVPRWRSGNDEDRALEAHALHLVDLRKHTPAPPEY
jgi:acyl-CoA hydrolase